MSTNTIELPADDSVDRINWPASIPFIAFHVAAVVGVFLVELRPALLGWALFSYAFRMWGMTAGYHRYFSHRSFETSRAFQFLLALAATLAVQKGPLWWAAHHRFHHTNADEPQDIHSPTFRGVLWAHMGWFLCDKYKETKWERVPDLAKYPELRFIDKYATVPPVIGAVLLWYFGGWPIFVWAGLVATVAQWHGLFIANSLCHMYGWKPFDTPDDGRNNPFFAVLLMGEGWHNNHHYYPGAARQGFVWWELDPTYYSIKLLEKLRLVWNVHGVPQRVLDARG